MKQFFVLIASLLILMGFSPPNAVAMESASNENIQRADAFFEEGVELYRRGEYGPAVIRFEAALEAGSKDLSPPQRVRILRAMGNSSYRQGDALEAVGWYSAALRHAPRDAELLANVDLARSDAGMPALADGTMASDVDAYLHALLPSQARRRAFIGGLILSLALLFELLRGGRAATAGVVLAAFIALVMALPWFASFLPEPTNPHLVLRANSLAVRSEPRADFPAVAHLESGAIVSQIDELDDWVRITGPENATGWVPAGAVFSLNR